MMLTMMSATPASRRATLPCAPSVWFHVGSA